MLNLLSDLTEFNLVKLNFEKFNPLRYKDLILNWLISTVDELWIVKMDLPKGWVDLKGLKRMS
jgi:hypothetical protein